MRILHTSDWHLGRQFHNVPLLDDQKYVIDQMVSYAIEESIDVFVIAGDIFDRSVPPSNAVAYFDTVLNKLHEAGIAVIVISGNHDGAERLGFGSGVLKKRGIYIVTDLHDFYEPWSFEKENYTVNFYALAFIEPLLIKRFLEGRGTNSKDTIPDLFADNNPSKTEGINDYNTAYRALINELHLSRDPNVYNILIAHCFVEGASSSESERPLSIGTLETVDPELFDGFDYVALGHLHGRQYKHRETIRYSGTPLKYSFSESNHQKSFTVIEVTEKGLVFDQVALKPIRDMRKVSGYLEDILKEGLKNPSDDYLYIDLKDTHALLDVMTKLRQVYPNVLSVERSGLVSNTRGVNAIDRKAIKNNSELNLFSDFYEQMTGQSLTETQESLLKNVIQDLYKDDH